MAERKFQDREGRGWRVRPESRTRWWLEPLPGNDEMKRAARPPGHTDDPFELSEKELQQLLDGALPSRGTARKPPPFREDEEEGQGS